MPTGAFGAGLSGGLAHGLMQGYQLQQYRDQLEQHKEELGLRKKLVESQAGLYDIETQKHNMAVQSALKQALMNESLGAQFEQMGQGQVAPRSQMDMGQDIMTLGRQYAAEAQPGELPQSVNPADIATTQTTPPAMEQNQANLRAMLARGGHIKEATEGMGFFDKPQVVAAGSTLTQGGKPVYTAPSNPDYQPVEIPGEPVMRFDKRTGKMEPISVGSGGNANGTITAPYKAEFAEVQRVAAELYPGESLRQLMSDPQKMAAVNQRVQKDAEAVRIAGRNITSVNVSTLTPAKEEAQKKFMDSSSITYNQLKQVPAQLENIEAAKALVPQARGFMGPGGEALLEASKFLNNRFGLTINTEGVKTAEELRSRIFFNVMDNLKKMDAQPSQMQQLIMQDALGKLGTDPNALPRMLDAYADVLRSKVDLYNKEITSAEKRGIQFPYDPIIQLPPKAATGPPKLHPSMPDGMTPKQQELWMKTYLKRAKP